MSTLTGRVTGRFVTGMYQGKRPIPAQGTIKLTPQADYVLHNGDTTILPTSVTAVLDTEGYICTPEISVKTRRPLYNLQGGIKTGMRGITLTATDDPNSMPKYWTWRVDFNLSSNGEKSPYKSFSFDLPSDSEVDLTKVTPVPGMSGYSTIEGPKGDSVHFAEEQNPLEISNPSNGLIVPFRGELYGYSNGWNKIGTMATNPVSFDVSVGGSTIKATKTAEGLVNLTGVVEGESIGLLPAEFTPEIELSFPVVSCDGGSQEVMTITTDGEVKTPSGKYSISHTFNPGRS